MTSNQTLAWQTSFWLWKTRVGNLNDVKSFKFGASTRALNSKECNGFKIKLAKKRFEIYKKVLKAIDIKLAPIEEGCYS